MPYFEDHYPKFSYPIATDDTAGLYRAQIGAIHAIASHFTNNNSIAVVTMPTGSGKTAVLMSSAFVLRAKRVLVITPSRMVRDQIFKDFDVLKTLKSTGSVPDQMPKPNVYEIRSKITSMEKWRELESYDVVISTPQCVSSALTDIPNPPTGLFDLLLIDEAHHSPARTWNHLLESFVGAKKILFTATPFRRDRREIKGKFVYTYPISSAYEDGIFGEIEFVPANVGNEEIDNDKAIAKKAEEVLLADQQAGKQHALMVRTDTKKRAEDLVKIYERETNLSLELVHSGLSVSKYKSAIEKLENGEINGIICVDMLGEGFNLPKLKIAAIHSPHKSLETTLQFIGRFARTNASNLGRAKFVAVPAEIEIEGNRLYEEGAIWQKMIIGMSQMRTDDEVETREMIAHFEHPLALDAEIEDLSLYSLSPREHVKIFKLSQDVDIQADIALKPPFDVVYTNYNEELSALLLVTREVVKPKWAKSDLFLHVKYDLIIVYYDEENKFLFINSSRSIDSLYQEIADALAPKSRALAMCEVNKVLRGLQNINFFNVGMRNRMQSTNSESYRISTGSSAQSSIRKSYARMFRQGHAFCTAEVDGEKINIGISSSGKIWGSSSMQIPHLIRWFKMLATKISARGSAATNSQFDFLPAGRIVSSIPEKIIGADWNPAAYDYDPPVLVRYFTQNREELEGHISELQIDVNLSSSNTEHVELEITAEGLSVKYKFSLTTDKYFTLIGSSEEPMVLIGERETKFSEWLNSNPIILYTTNLSALCGNELLEFGTDISSYDENELIVTNWSGVDIEREFGTANSIHNFLCTKLLQDTENKIVFYDHGKGEIADLVAIKSNEETIIVSFYHCKASGAAIPRSRPTDMYEVCLQTVKSTVWVKQSKFRKKMIDRSAVSEFKKGSIEEFKTMINRDTNKRIIFEFIAVQPGLSRSGVNEQVREILIATSDSIVAAGWKFSLWCSA